MHEVSSLPTYRAVGIQVEGSYAYLAEDWAGMKVINISNPSSPREVGIWNTPGNAEEIAVSDGRAFIADGPSGLRVVDVSNPEIPVGLSAYDTQGYAWDVSVSAGFAYVADGINGLAVIDVSNPSVSVGVGNFLPERQKVEVRAVEVNWPFAYLAAGYSGFHYR